jgi:hypothetical protein
MPPFFSENVITITITFTWMILTSSAIMRLFFHKVSVILNTLLPALSKTLYTTHKIPCLEFGSHHEWCKETLNCDNASVDSVLTER